MAKLFPKSTSDGIRSGADLHTERGSLRTHQATSCTEFADSVVQGLSENFAARGSLFCLIGLDEIIT